MYIQQTALASGNKRTVVWLPRDPRVKVGSVISFAKDDTRWRVLEQYGVQEHSEIRRNWNVGGLS
jgi:hypothetical protein